MKIEGYEGDDHIEIKATFDFSEEKDLFKKHFEKMVKGMAEDAGAIVLDGEDPSQKKIIEAIQEHMKSQKADKYKKEFKEQIQGQDPENVFRTFFSK